MKLLDLSKFGKIAEDKHTTTLKHQDGHTMTILHEKLPRIQKEQLKRLKMADGGDVPSPEPSPQANQSPSPDSTPDSSGSDKSITINVGTPAPAAPSAPVAQAPAQPAPAPRDPGALPASPNLANPNNAAQIPAQSLNLATKAADEQQQVDAAKAQGTIPIAQEQQYNAQAIQDRQQQTIADMQAHTQAFADYMTQHPINPKAYMENMGTGSKVANALGLILGGFSAGHSGTGVNPAYNYLMDQQNKDIDAQKARMDQAKTIYGAYHQLYNDENTSTALTKVSMNDKLIADANVLAAKLGTPQAAANRDALVAKLQDEKYKQLQAAAFLANAPKYSQPAGAQGNIKPSSPGKQMAPSQKYGAENADPDTGLYNFQPILNRNAAAINDDQARRASGGDPVAAAQFPIIQKQYADAEQKDQILSRAQQIYSDLKKNVTPGGFVSRNNPLSGIGTALGSVPLIGGPAAAAVGALGQYAGEGVTYARENLAKAGFPGAGNGQSDEFSKNRQYETARQELGDLLRKAYPGIGGDEYNHKLSAITPDYTDKAVDTKAKMRAFEDLIKTSGEYNILRDRKMAN